MAQNLKQILDEKALQYNSAEFIESDPICIPHSFSHREDIEISAFLSASIAWGQRKTIIGNARKLMELMDHAPAAFIKGHSSRDRLVFKGFVHRTFNFDDLNFFLSSLQHIYLEKGGLEAVFRAHPEESNTRQAISRFRKVFFGIEHLRRTEKHVSDPMKNSACKRINMFLRWMVRSDGHGVDFGIWDSIKSSQLSCPLDVHTGNVARSLGLLNRKANDWKAVEELDAALRKFDPKDPVKYDFALFGMGVFEGLGR